MREQESPPTVLPLEKAVTFGQILIQPIGAGRFRLCHRDDAEKVSSLEKFENPEEALQIARTDDAGKYRALKTAPNLRHGWLLELGTVDLSRALDYFYPGRVALFEAWKKGRLKSTAVRDTLGRQSGMYRIAATISDEQLDDLIGNFCRSDTGCLRTILWKRDASGTIPSTKLPSEKFDPGCDQVAIYSSAAQRPENVPLLCQEACNLLIAECRKAVKDRGNNL
jgi:sirohydrochlorin cobaltochelatase